GDQRARPRAPRCRAVAGQPGDRGTAARRRVPRPDLPRRRDKPEGGGRRHLPHTTGVARRYAACAGQERTIQTALGLTPMTKRSALPLLVMLALGAALRADGQERTDRFGIDAAGAAAVLAGMDRERQLRIPMRDGVRLNADILFPPGEREGLPAILIRTPYALKGELDSWAGPLSRWLHDGYAVVVSHERGRHWSEGEYRVLGGAFEDGYDTVEWITRQSWSNGKVGTIGCSSSAENQMGLAAAAHPGHAAMIAMSPNAGIGVIGPHREQGNWFRGGVNQMWIDW